MKTAISNLKNFRKAEAVSQVEKSLINISNQLKTDETYLPQYLEVLLGTVLPNYDNILHLDIVKATIDYWFNQPKYQILSSLISSIKNPESWKFTIQYLRKWAKHGLYAKALSSSQGEIQNELLNLCFSIPDRVAPLFKSNGSISQEDSKFQEDSEEQGSHPQLPRAFLPSLLRERGYFQKFTSTLSFLTPQILTKFTQLHLLEYFWSDVSPSRNSLTKFNSSLITDCSLSLPPSALSPYLLSVLESTDPPLTHELLLPPFTKIERAHKLLLNHFLTQKVISESALDSLLSFLEGQGCGLSALEACADVWSRHRLLTQMSSSLHKQLSRAIMRLTPKISREALLQSSSSTSLMSGVSAHIGLADSEIRKDGLRIGELISSILVPDSPAKFDELHPSSEEEAADELAPRSPLPTPEDETPETTKSESESDDDIDRPFVARIAMESDSESDSDGLVPFAIDDDAGNDGKRILHPRELLAAFRTDENDVDRYKKFTAACSASADVVRKMSKLEVTQFGTEVLQTLLNTDNEYNEKDFDEQIKAALVALMTTHIQDACRMVTSELSKKRTYSLGKRVFLLNAISYAASELAEIPKPEKTLIKQVEANTKRWGNAKRIIKRVVTANRFAPVAPNYFYGIIAASDLDQEILEEDCLEATQVLTTLAIVLEAAGESTLQRPRMAEDMMTIAGKLLAVRAPNGRRALLFAIAAAANALPDYRGNDFIGEFIGNEMTEDPDEVCREIALTTARMLNQRIENDRQNLLMNL